MCGIAGILDRTGQTVDRDTLERMCAALVHRGPDSAGFHLDGGTALGMRRLQVIDLVSGEQPIATPDGRYHIVFNGEIYNYRELRSQLEELGHRFATRSDTEVLLHLYQEHGTGMFARLNGMYAFAVWDRERQELLLARDRVGIKPLYYCDTPGRLLFASEISALFASGLVSREMEPGLLPALFTLQYIPGPRTLFRGVLRLPPGSYLRADRSGVELRSFSDEVAVPPPTSHEEARQQLRDTLSSAVRYRMIADVPIGAFLSGGIDSSILVGLMTQLADRPIQTFSVGFETAGAFDELHHARLVARHFGSDHHELVVSSADLADKLATALDHLDDPIADPAVLPTLMVSELARRHVTVALSGEGADELFGGYRRYCYQHALRLLPAGLWRLLPRLGGHRVRQALGALAEADPLESHLAWSRTTSGALASRLLSRDALAESERYLRERLGSRLSPGSDRARVTGAMRIDQAFWLVDDLLTKVDRMSMACSLEARVPYLDTRVVDLANSLPLSWKIRGLTGKRILREAYADLLPPQILRRPKQGFDLPLTEWFRTSLRSYLLDQLTGLRSDPLLDRSTLDRIVSEHLDGRDEYPVLLFSLLVYSHLVASSSKAIGS